MTEILLVDREHSRAESIGRAAELILRGRLVAFPTETVYGLGANALDAAAVARIFAAKGRPGHNPLIVHVPNVAAARQLTASWPVEAERLAAKFWPGPLTMVLPKRAEVPAITTGSGDSVGVRVPAHPVALALLRAARVPIAAPSANRSLHISPTRAEHVAQSLGDRVELILDGGPTSGGLESTVVDLSGETPRVLRPGLIDLVALQAVLPTISCADDSSRESTATDRPLPAPGQLARHYAPRTRLELVPGELSAAIERCRARGERVAVMSFGPVRVAAPWRAHASKFVEMPTELAAYSAALYATLYQLDDGTADRVLVCLPPRTPGWEAVHDRLSRAAHHDGPGD